MLADLVVKKLNTSVLLMLCQVSVLHGEARISPATPRDQPKEQSSTQRRAVSGWRHCQAFTAMHIRTNARAVVTVGLNTHLRRWAVWWLCVRASAAQVHA